MGEINSNTIEINNKKFNISEERDRKKLKKFLFKQKKEGFENNINIEKALLELIDFYFTDTKKVKTIEKRKKKIIKLLKGINIEKNEKEKMIDGVENIFKSEDKSNKEVLKNKNIRQAFIGKKLVIFKKINEEEEDRKRREEDERKAREEDERKVREEERKRAEEEEKRKAKEKIEKKWKEKTNNYIKEELEKNKVKAGQFKSENIEVTNSVISFVTDLHGDNSSLSISLKQTGFIKNFNEELVVYDVKNNRFLSEKEFENLRQNNNMSYEDFIRQFVVIPDFEIPDNIPEGFFVNGGDMNDRGAESAENYVMMIRLRQKYGEKLKDSGYSEDKIKQKLNEKFPIALGDHELYKISLSNEEKNIKTKAEEKALEELKKDYPKEDEKNLKEKYKKEFEEYESKYRNIYTIEFEKTHEIIKNMQKEGAITFGGSVGDTNTFCFHSCPDANSVALLVMAAIFPYNKELFDKIDSRINKDVIENLQNKLKGNIKNKEIFDKIKVNLFESIFKEKNTTNKNLKELCEEFLKQNKDKSLNDIFINLRKHIGIPTNEEEYKNERSLKAKESLEIYSEIGSILDLQINKKDNPLLVLATFRDSFTDRAKGEGGFLDSENLNGNGVSSAPIHGTIEENLKIVFGHTSIKAIKNIFDKIQISKIYEKTTGKKIIKDEFIKINGGLVRFKEKTNEEIENQALEDLKYDIKSIIKKEKNFSSYSEIPDKEVEEKLKLEENKNKLEENIKKIKEEQNFYLKIKEEITKEKFDEFCLKNSVIPNDNNVSNGYNKPSETSVLQIDKSGCVTVIRHKRTKDGTVELLESRKLGFIPTACIESTKEQTQKNEKEQENGEKKLSESMEGAIGEFTQEIGIVNGK